MPDHEPRAAVAGPGWIGGRGLLWWGLRLPLPLACLAACEDQGPSCGDRPLDPDLVGRWTVVAGPDSFWTGGTMAFLDDGGSPANTPPPRC